MKICLLSPPTSFLEYNGFPPLNLLYLSSFIKENGYYNVQIIDQNITEEIPVVDVYAITATTPQFPFAVELLPKLKELNPNSVTIIGGSHATSDYISCYQFDKIIIGDGEVAIIECLKDIHVKSNKHVYIGKQILDIDKIPMPDRKLVNGNYNYRINGELSTLQMTSRGCTFNCHFCFKKHKNVRFHSNQYVIKEIENIKECGYKGIYFMDDIFTLRKDLLDLGSFLEDISWQCQIRPDEKLENIRKLGKMKCSRVSIGLESGSQQILDSVNKKVKLRGIFDVIKECKKQNIKVHPYIILGLPGENHDTVRETIDLLRRIEPDSVGISIFVPYPGTYIYNHIDQFDIKIEETDYRKWNFRGGNGGYNCVVSTEGLTREDILKYREEIDKEFN